MVGAKIIDNMGPSCEQTQGSKAVVEVHHHNVPRGQHVTRL